MVGNMIYSYASGDIETLGLNPLTNKLIEIGFILDDSRHRIDYNNIDCYIKSLPTFHCYIRHDNYDGDAYAVNLNKDIIKLIKENKHESIVDLDHVSILLDTFFSQYLNQRIMPAGKNFSGFDRQFLNQIPGVKDILDKWFIHRTMDPALYYFDENVDSKLPDLKQCLQRANIDKSVAHNAVEDAEDVIRLLRYTWDKSYM
jgi:oligoribonuclease (3'-5' exoribonuclease)